jgi:hypothetical protein
MPPATHVPDDAVHGDDLDAARAARNPVAYAPPPPPPRPPMPRGAPGRPGVRGRAKWLLFAGAGAAIVVGSSTDLVSHSHEEREVVPRAVSQIVVEGGSMDVEIVDGAASGKVEITRQAHWGFGGEKPVPIEQWTDAKLTIGQPDCAGMGSCSIDYVIKVPAGTALAIENSSGDINVAGNLGLLDLETASGDVEAENLEATGIQVRTASGDISLELDAAVPSIDLKAASGDIKVEVPEGAQFAVDASTRSGDTEVEIQPNPSSANHLKVETSSGDVDIEDN